MLNPGQQAALALDKHISLTAGAGTGKTSVLVERYMSILENRAASATGVLALTFTEKAAAEMKTRVRQTAAAKLTSATGEPDPAFWERIIEDIQEPDICTFHSLCAKLLREFPIEAGVDPSYTVMDESEATIKFEETLECFLSRIDGADDERLTAITGIFTRRKLHAALASLYSKRGNAKSWAKTYAGRSPDEAITAMKSFVASWLADSLDLPFLESCRNTLAQESCSDENDKLFGIYAAALDALDAILNKRSTDFSALSRIDLRGGKTNSWNDLKSLKETLKNCRDYALKLTEIQFRLRDETAAIASSALASLFLEFCGAIENAKGDGLVLDFDDLEEKTLALLVSSPATGEALRRRYKFILVDEFQDTNEVQWKIIRLLASAGAESKIENNIFIVGDEKQSIYAFRGANVSMFARARRELDAANDGVNGMLELSVCYRSHPELLKFFNAVFPRIFRKGRSESYLPEIEYFDLRPERETDDKTGSPSIEFIMPETAEMDENESRADTSKWEIEAAAAAERIRQLLENGEEITTRSVPGGRPLRPGDIAVLFRSRTHLPEYQNALKSLGIPFTIAGGLGFYECREVMDLVNIIGFLAHPCDDMNLAGTLRSPHICLSDEDMLAISTMRGKYLFDKLRSAASEKDIPGYTRIKHAYELLSRWKNASGRVYISELLGGICRDTGIFAIASIGDGHETKKLNVEKLFAIARAFERRGNSGIARFAEYIENKIARMERESEATPAEQGLDAVNMMTVHAAKGLEFPVVIIAGMSATSARDLSDEFLLEEVAPGRVEAGFTVPDPENDYASKASAVRGITKIVVERKHDEEQKRLLYVACTRAREKLIFCGTRPELFDNEGTPALDAPDRRWDGMLTAAMKVSDFHSLDYKVTPVTVTDAAAGKTRSFTDIKPSSSNVRTLYSEIVSNLPAPDPETVTRCLKYLPALQPDADKPARISVTAILSYLRDPASWQKNNVVGVPLSWQITASEANGESTSGISPLLRGAIVHKLFEDCAAIAPGDEKSYLQKILNENGVSDEQTIFDFEEHYLPRLKGFIESPIGRDIASSESHRELNFSLRIERHILTGMIDLIYGSLSGWTIIDYKTDVIDAESIKEKDGHYKLQLEMYCLAVMDAMPELQTVSSRIYYIEPSMLGELLIVDRRRAAGLREELAAALAGFSIEDTVETN